MMVERICIDCGQSARERRALSLKKQQINIFQCTHFNGNKACDMRRIRRVTEG